MDFHGITIDRIRHSGMYCALVPGAGYVKADTVRGIKKAIRDNWQPAATLCRFPFAVHLFEWDDSHVIARHGSAWTDSPDSVDRATIRRYKVYYSGAKDDYWFNIHGRRYWFSECIRTGTPWG